MHSTLVSPNSSNPFLTLPPELHAEIFEQLGFPPESLDVPPEYGAWAALERTCRMAQEITEPYLYHKIYTNVRTGGKVLDTPWKTDKKRSERASAAFNTTSLLALLERRPRLQKVVHFLVLDEYDPLALRRLLRLKLERLESLICQHEGDVPPVVISSMEDPEAQVNQHSNLTNFVLNIHQKPDDPFLIHLLSLSDAPLFNQSSLTRLRLSYLDLTLFENLPEAYFKHAQLRVLNFEHCKYSLTALKRVLQPAQNLTTVYLHFDQNSPFTAEEERDVFIPLLQSICGKTLRILKLLWRDVAPKSENWTGWDLTGFEALRYLHIPPEFLFPKDGVPTLEMLSGTIPPRVKMLALEGLIPLNFPGRDLGLGINLSQYDFDLLEALIAFKAAGNVPSFRHLFVFYSEWLAGIPQKLVKKAERQGVTIGFMQIEDQMHLDSVDVEWLDGEVEWLDGDGSDEGSDEDDWEDEDEDEDDDEEDDDEDLEDEGDDELDEDDDEEDDD